MTFGACMENFALFLVFERLYFIAQAIKGTQTSDLPACGFQMTGIKVMGALRKTPAPKEKGCLDPLYVPRRLSQSFIIFSQSDQGWDSDSETWNRAAPVSITSQNAFGDVGKHNLIYCVTAEN